MADTGTLLTQADVDKIADQVRNWGRWGADDERGALNLITDAKRAAAAALVRAGTAVSCAQELPVQPGPDNQNPVQHYVVRGGDAQDPNSRFGTSADFFAIAPHGLATTHLDALCHIFVDGQMFNGFSQTEVRTDGAHRGSIMAAADGVISRGVLLDIPALRGVPWLDPGDAIVAAELDAAAERQQVRVEPGDVLMVMTGRDARRAEHGVWSPREGLAGLYADCLPWLHAHGVAVLGSDGVSDVTPGRVEGWPLPMHQIAIVSMGVHLIDNMRLDRLAEECASCNRWEFLFTLAPLRLARGTASPVNPIAVF